MLRKEPKQSIAVDGKKLVLIELHVNQHIDDFP